MLVKVCEFGLIWQEHLLGCRKCFSALLKSLQIKNRCPNEVYLYTIELGPYLDRKFEFKIIVLQYGKRGEETIGANCKSQKQYSFYTVMKKVNKNSELYNFAASSTISKCWGMVSQNLEHYAFMSFVKSPLKCLHTVIWRWLGPQGVRLGCAPNFPAPIMFFFFLLKMWKQKAAVTTSNLKRPPFILNVIGLKLKFSFVLHPAVKIGKLT